MLITLLLLLGLIGFPFVGYPILLMVRAKLLPASTNRERITPTVDLIICAFNEQDDIADKIQNALNQDYPKDRLKIWIASDGSTDQTVDIANQFAGDRVVVLDLERGGKANALKKAVELGSGHIIAFSDANSIWHTNALQNMVDNFADKSVGGVAGDQRYCDSEELKGLNGDLDLQSYGERGYWSFDRQLKLWQSQAGNTISATGAIYCIRRRLYQPPPPDATDDFMISTGVIDAGERLIFEPLSVAVEPPAPAAGLEFRRKTRVITRGLRSIYYRRNLLNPLKTGVYAFELLVHKLWRRMVWLPVVAIVVLAPFAIVSGGLPGLIGMGIGSVTLLTAAAFALPSLQRYKLFALLAYITMVNAACIVATYNSIRGQRVAQWQLPRKTENSDPTLGDAR